LLYYERKLKKAGFQLIVGIDEAGRGPLAGPVVAAAVALRSLRFKSRIDDSKKLTARQRDEAFSEIIRKSVYGIGIVNERAVDSVNIARASCFAMEEALNRLIDKLNPAQRENICVLVDGNLRLSINYPYLGIVKGDAKSKSIASASILAKVTRDCIMSLYDRLYPEYGFLRHKGYPTKAHRRALKQFGPSLIHRMSFRGV